MQTPKKHERPRTRCPRGQRVYPYKKGVKRKLCAACAEGSRLLNRVPVEAFAERVIALVGKACAVACLGASASLDHDRTAGERAAGGYALHEASRTCLGLTQPPAQGKGG